jgi:hypothetical protein
MTLNDVTAIIESLKSEADPLAAIEARLAATRETMALLESLRGLFGDGPGKSVPAPASAPNGPPRAGNKRPVNEIRESRRHKIARHIRRNGMITATEAATVVGVSRPTAVNDLAHPWFTNATDPSGLRFGLTDAGASESTDD